MQEGPSDESHHGPGSGLNGVTSDAATSTGWDPEAIARARFVVGLRGYNREDVEAFLRGVADNYGRVLRELEQLRAIRSSAAATTPYEGFGPPTGDGDGPDAEVFGVPGGADGGATPPRPVDPAEEQEREPEPEAVAEEAAPEGGPAAATPGGSTPTGSAPGSHGTEAVLDGSPASTWIAEMLLAAEDEAWKIRDEAERALDDARSQSLRLISAAESEAAELRDRARQSARDVLGRHEDMAAAASSVSKVLLDADQLAAQAVERAALRSREMRRTAYRQLLEAEHRARDVVARAQDELLVVLRMAGPSTGRPAG